MKDSLTYTAMMFAKTKHKDQKRKYTNEPYFIHLAEVAALVETVADSHEEEVRREVMISTAWNHDTIEDQGVTYDELGLLLGKQIATGVLFLSDLEEGNRATRKQLARDRLKVAPAWVQSIKVADLCSNSPSIITHDPNFAVTYVREVQAYLDVLLLADMRLRIMLGDIIKDYRNK